MKNVGSLLKRLGFVEISPRGHWGHHDDGYGAPCWVEHFKAPDLRLLNAAVDWCDTNGQAACEAVIREYGWEWPKLAPAARAQEGKL